MHTVTGKDLNDKGVRKASDMARGYSIEQLRNELQSDAQLKCEELEKTVVELQKQLTEKEEKLGFSI